MPGENPSGYALEVRGVSKTFPGQVALDRVDLDVRFGEIHALVGENGSGKSTLVKCIAGYHTPDPGSSIHVANQLVRGDESPSGRARGVASVHQDLGIIPQMTVAENIALGSGFAVGRTRRINWAVEQKRAAVSLRRLGRPDILPDAVAGELSAPNQAFVALARAFQTLGGKPGLVVLDEVTAALPEGEVSKLFSTLRSITAQGSGVLMVSHRLREIFEVADRVTVIRDGRNVRTCSVGDVNESELTELIIGRQLGELFPTVPQPTAGQCLLRTHRLCGRGFRTVDLTVDRGEIVGLAGLMGSGKSELLRVLFGAGRRSSGSVEVEGEAVSLTSPRDGLALGVGYVPSDRLRCGGFPQLTLVENLTLAALATKRRTLYISPTSEAWQARRLMERYHVRPSQPSRQFSTLSGGNQQKLILARVIGMHPRLLLLDEPTQGVDVGAKAEIYQIIRNVAADEEAGVVVASSDAEELVELCHKIVVLDRGRVSSVLHGAAVTEDQLQNAVYARAGAASA